MTVLRTDLIPNLFPNKIVGVSQANPAVVSVPVVARVVSTTGTISAVSTSGITSGVTTFTTVAGTSVTAAATYTAVSQSATSGTGTGAVFTIVKAGAGTAYSGAVTITTTTVGSGYAVGDTITISGANLGGVSTTNDMTLTLGAGSLAGPWTATISNMTSTEGMLSGDVITATAGTGSFSAAGEVSIDSVTGNQSIVIRKIGGSSPTAGTVTNITEPATSSLPPFIVDGAIVQITGVEGMTQLETAGASNTNWFYVDVLSGNTFALYRNVGLSTAVNSSAFSAATANTGQYTTIDTVVITESP